MTRQRALQAAAAPVRPAERALAGVSASAGQPLDRATRAEMEPLFGHDFGRVRVHTHAAAAGAAQAIGARAYTVGHHVAFGAMRHDPASAAGRRLLAHELAHVVQQSGAAAPGPDGRLRTAGAAEERAAEQAAGRVAAGRRAPAPQPVATPALACFSDDNHHVIEEAA
uniref:eCIS core domain-containing protein n=1 Tax=Sphingomonas sp. TaxID=28214 RepID=UPI0035BC2596